MYDLMVQLTQKTAKKKRKLSRDLRLSWKLREAVGSADKDSDGISDEKGHYIADLTDHATYARSLGFPEPFPEYVSHLEEAEVQERLNNRSLPAVSLWIHIFQPLLKLARVDFKISPRDFYLHFRSVYVSHLIFFCNQ